MTGPTGLDGLLSGEIAPGLHVWRSAIPVDLVRVEAEAAGWGFAVVALDPAPSEVHGSAKADALTAFKAALDLPAYVGANLDALWDGLREIAEPLLVLWEGWELLAEADPHAFRSLVRLLTRRAQQGGFSVLLRGDGPASDLPDLG
ncbi:barstar family protein [Nocardioides insulae]|uniref:barstar family protein n=1 Tax=Nocardioides insulae TaxID=394734 RepID=UPI0004038EE7|nr:barstar family protein [Nocardioides insulae]